jgi:hypothetical protein
MGEDSPNLVTLVTYFYFNIFLSFGKTLARRFEF